MLCLCKLTGFQLSSWVFLNLKIIGSVSAIEASRAVLRLGSDLFCIPYQFLGQIGILLQRSKLESSLQLLEALSQFNLNPKFVNIRPVTVDDVEKAFSFSISARLSQRWHQVGRWLVDSKQNFLNIEGDRNTFQAIKFEIRFSEISEELGVWACNDVIQLFPVKPQDLVLNIEDLAHLMEDADSIIYLQPDAKNRFHYLPRLNCGNLVSISRFLLDSSPFRSYGELWLYWQEQYGYNLPEDPEGLVYFNVTFNSDKTVYTYPSCCVFLKQPILQCTSAEVPTEILRLFFKDFEPLVSCWYAERNLKFTLNTANTRIPWQEKLASDILHDNDVKKHIRPPEGLNGRSKYFNDVMSYTTEKKAEAQNNSMQGRKKLANSRITEYFSSRHPGIRVRRSANKITFQPQNTSRHANPVTLNRQRNSYSVKQLESFDVMKLQKWMKEHDIPFDPCDSQQGLIQKVKESIGFLHAINDILY